jgi:dephospho-CoA kinase
MHPRIRSRTHSSMARALALARVAFRHPALMWPLIRTGWRFRRKGWFAHPPFLPIPPAEYLDWRLHTAYGDEDHIPDASDLRRYLHWARWMAKQPSDGGYGRQSRGREPFRVGLTGNVASGKSSVARVWSRMGARVIDADELARRAVEPGSPGLAAIRAEFGPTVLAADGSLDRAAMRRRILEDPSARRRLEMLVHPEVGRLREREERRAIAEGARVVVHDIPLLFEVGLDRDFDLLVLVDAPGATRAARLIEQRGLEPWEAERLIGAQDPADGKREGSDIIIDNTGSIEELEAKAAEAWREIERRARW